MVRAHTKVEVNGIKGKLTNSKKNEAIKDLLMCHKNLKINQICYGILAAFCAAGVSGLMVWSDDWRTSSVKGALSLIDISEKLSEGKNLVEPVWLRTNKFEFSRCLVLDSGDARVAKRGLGSSDEVNLTVH
ncbi:hypothetical protein O181_130818, partial [Austropuccinia psidii MF-1]|nr:hypothetical protein [Austropuccinia psidii MF-1]